MGGDGAAFGASNLLQPRRTSSTAPARVGRGAGDEKPRMMARLDAAVAWGRKQKQIEEVSSNLVTNESHFVGQRSSQASAKGKGHTPWVSRPSDAGAGVRRPALPWQQLIMNAGNAAFRRRGDGRRHGGGKVDGDEVRGVVVVLLNWLTIVGGIVVCDYVVTAVVDLLHESEKEGCGCKLTVMGDVFLDMVH